VTGRRLIVSADDLGLTAGVDRGIAAAIEAGSVTAVGVLANLADPAAVARLAAEHPGVSFGAHLNLTTGRPVLAAGRVPSLVDARGVFRPLGEQTRRALGRRLDATELTRELEAQLAALVDAGVAVDHLDSHEHVHLLPGVTGAVVGLAHRSGVRRIRSHRPRLCGAAGAPWRAVLAYYCRHPRRLLTHAVKRVLAARLACAGLVSPDGMVGTSLLLGPVPPGPGRAWEAVCAGLPCGTWELVVHPADLSVARSAEDEARLGTLLARRGEELAALLAPGFPAMVRGHGVVTTSFATLPAGRAPSPVVGRAQEIHAERGA
jgi:hypothetical protein